MRVLLINQFFFPDVAAVAQFMTDLAEDLTKRGAEVSVLCGHARYSRQQNPLGEEGQHVQSLKVHRTFSLRLRGRSGAIHLMNYLSFLLAAPLRATLLPKHDCSLVFTNPPLIASAGWLLKRLRGTKFVYVVEDLYPDVAIQLGFLRRNSRVTQWLSRLSIGLLQRADRVVALGDGMKQALLERGVQEEKIVIIPNWADGEQVYPLEAARNWFVGHHRLAGKFVVQYSGHLGEAHDFSTMLGAARKLNSRDDIVFQFIGEGPRKREIEAFKRDHRLRNVVLLPYQQRQHLRYSLGAADVGLISLKPELEPLMLPSKVYGIMAAGRPFLYIGSEEGDISQLARVARCGFTVPLGNVDLLEKLILKLYQDESLRQTLGRNARAFFLANFDRKVSTARYYDLLNDVLGNGTRVTSAPPKDFPAGGAAAA